MLDLGEQHHHSPLSGCFQGIYRVREWQAQILALFKLLFSCLVVVVLSMYI